MQQLSENLYLYRDTCHVYVVRQGEMCVLVDFGSGSVLDSLDEIGVRQVSDILLTHHHRDQCQGLSRAAAAGIRIWAPHTEQDLFHSVDRHWQARQLLNNYDVRQDRFSLLEPVALSGTLQDYQTYAFGGRKWTVVPIPGHTPGSIGLIVEVDGRRAAFTGDLIAGAGKVWSMAALQWSYQGMEGAAASILSLLDLRNRRPDCLLPSHGAVMEDPEGAIDLLVSRLRRLLDHRKENLRMESWLCSPYEHITPHLLRNRTSVANSYVLLSKHGKALLIDYGYDFVTGNRYGGDRSQHRPWLYTIPKLKEDFEISKIDAVLATHYHDDHVAGFNLLRSVEGAQVWAAESFAHILENPTAYNLPCLWYDPIPVDRVLPLAQPVQWEEYTLVLHPLPGHTRYAVAVEFEVDGKRVLATGDQYKGNDCSGLNYVYQNGFDLQDYMLSADLFSRCAPDLILPGHWEPLWVTGGYFNHLHESGAAAAQLHRELLLLDQIDLGGEGFPARIQPYTCCGRGGEPIQFQVEVRNPLPERADLRLQLHLPAGWQADPVEQVVTAAAGETICIPFQVTPPPGLTGRRFRLAVDLTAGSLRLGEQAEALVDLV
ncbi:MAG: MBL fold metallo-hydrolase [Chloroflexi bacterium]|nr:MBL fold metallo-hydrolase [Chloroflexota bacterium]